MSIQHKFLQTDFGNGFETHNAILDTTPYKPEVMIIGTFNPNTPNANFADFFYGRNYFWTAFQNLFTHNRVVLESTRMPKRGKPKEILDPTLPEILQLCSKLKLTFSDQIAEVLQNDTKYTLYPNDNVSWDGTEYNLIQDGGKGKIGGLQELDKLGQVRWTTENIIKYLIENPQIQTIYFTRQPKGIWGKEWSKIVNNPELRNRKFTNFFTPSAQSLAGQPRMNSLIRHWIFNDNSKFGKINNDWLKENGVNIENFK